MKPMDASQIPSFVNEVVGLGCNMTAITGAGYVIGDADLAPERYQEIEPELSRICDSYGARDHLLREITDYLISIGRYYPVPSLN